MTPEQVANTIAESTGVVLPMWDAAEIGNAVRDQNWPLVQVRLVGLIGRDDEEKVTKALRYNRRK